MTNELHDAMNAVVDLEIRLDAALEHAGERDATIRKLEQQLASAQGRLDEIRLAATPPRMRGAK